MNNDTLKLYRVKVRGFAAGWSTHNTYQTSYVVAHDPETAYQMVRTCLDQADYGFPDDRELVSVELLAENVPHAACRARLFVQPSTSPSP